MGQLLNNKNKVGFKSVLGIAGGVLDILQTAVCGVLRHTAYLYLMIVALIIFKSKELGAENETFFIELMSKQGFYTVVFVGGVMFAVINALEHLFNAWLNKRNRNNPPKGPQIGLG